MVVFKAAYRDAGFVVTEDELPDFLPIVLDFAALCPKGERLLCSHRTDLKLLRRALVKRPRLPVMDDRDRAVRAACGEEERPG